MTPSELLDRAKEQFPVLYLTDETQLRHLVTQCLGKFQDRAGVIKAVETVDDENFVAIPADFLDVASVMDAHGNFHPWKITADQIVVTTRTYWISVSSVEPFTIKYWVNLRGYDIANVFVDWAVNTTYQVNNAVATPSGDKFICISSHTTAADDTPPPADTYDATIWKPYLDLPNDAIGILLDYLVALIDIKNTDRARNVALATGRQIELPSNQELNERKNMIEVSMDDYQAIIPVATVRG